MLKLNFPDYSFRFKESDGTPLIFDLIRKRFMVLTPEEWVRQHVVNYLISELHYPKSHINVEKQLLLNNTKKRYDIVVYNADGTIQIIVECKAPSIKITQDTFDQIARYNLVTDATFLMVTNGLDHFYCKMDYEKEKYLFLRELPERSSP